MAAYSYGMLDDSRAASLHPHHPHHPHHQQHHMPPVQHSTQPPPQSQYYSQQQPPLPPLARDSPYTAGHRPVMQTQMSSGYNHTSSSPSSSTQRHSQYRYAEDDYRSRHLPQHHPRGQIADDSHHYRHHTQGQYPDLHMAYQPFASTSASPPPQPPPQPHHFQPSLPRHSFSRQKSFSYDAAATPPAAHTFEQDSSMRDDVSFDGSRDGHFASPSKIPAGAKPVVRAACLSCRTAKRRCDGVQPVCGPCVSRGVTADSAACVFVASKRGGPRFKGCTGEEAKRIKAEKEQKKLGRAGTAVAQTQAVGSRAQHPHQMSFNERHASADYLPGASSHRPDLTTVSSSNYAGNPTKSDASSTSQGFDETAFSSSMKRHSSHGQASRTLSSPNSQSGAPSTKHQQQRHPYSNGMSPAHASAVVGHQSALPGSFLETSGSITPADVFARLAAQDQAIAQRRTEPDDPTKEVQMGSTADKAPPQRPAVYENGQSALSSANLELWQKIQENSHTNGGAPNTSTEGVATNTDPDAAFGGLGSFWTRLESLPKAGNVADVGAADSSVLKLLDANSDDKDGVPLDSADSEQQARFLLTAFFDKVYASAPVLLAPENLSSLAFWFSGKGPCALYAAISALVTLRLPENEAYKTLRGGYQHGAEGVSRKTKAEIAAHHARTSQFLLRRFSQQQAAAAAASFGLDPNTLSSGCDPEESGRSLCQGPTDPELLRIEAAAAHTLLCHYFYSAGGHAAQAVAHEHALQAWNSLQGVRIELQEGQPPTTPLATSHFNFEQKQEWAKRVYWTSFAAAAVTACTGGFHPIDFTSDAVTALKLRPALESDVGAWGVFIRGTQHVARGYTALYDLQTLQDRKANENLSQEEYLQERARIFMLLCKLDRDMTTFSAYDPAWRSEPDTIFASGQQSLGYALRTAGKLMTAGATVIIHRGQAFANAHIFMHPQCGLPKAARVQDTKHMAAQQLLHTATRNAQARQVAEDPAGFTSSMDVDYGSGPPSSRSRSRSPSPSLSYAAPAASTAPNRLWHRSGSVSLPPAGGNSNGSGGQSQSFSSSSSGGGGGSATSPSVFGGDAANTALTALERFQIGGSQGGGGGGGGNNGHNSNGNGYVNGAHRQHHSPNGDGDVMMHGHTSSSYFGGPQQQHQLGASSSAHNESGTIGGHDGGANTLTSGGEGKALSQAEYAHGPFEPEYSAAKCKWAGDAMLESVRTLMRAHKTEEGDSVYPLGNREGEAPSLPPWSACSYVLGAYCVLMQCLVVQAARAWKRATAGGGGGGNNDIADEAFNAASVRPTTVKQSEEELDDELKRLQEQVNAVYQLLGRFAHTHMVAKEYQSEVGMLLEINRRLQ